MLIVHSYAVHLLNKLKEEWGKNFFSVCIGYDKTLANCCCGTIYLDLWQQSFFWFGKMEKQDSIVILIPLSWLRENRNGLCCYKLTRKVKKLFTPFLMQEKTVNLKLNLGNIFMRKKKFNIHMLFSLSALQSLLETIDAYVRRLWTLAKSYEYKRFENKLITDHIVISCLSFCL